MYLGDAAIMTPEEVAAYREDILSAQGLVNDGTGNYYSPDYYVGRDERLAVNAANVQATAESGVFSGVQGDGINNPLKPSQTVTVSPTSQGTKMQYTNPNSNIQPITDTAALGSIKAAYLAMIPGNIQGFVNLMIQYGVSIYDVANATQRDPAFIAAQLGQPDGFGGYSKKSSSSNVSSGSNSSVSTNAVTTQSAGAGMSPLLLGVAAVAAYVAFS